uniref:Odorant binding protein 19 n=1 Tax=Xylotrechus quadripes TaxID=554073 RepID=A0A346HGP1_9CUCU|nr:odorant binding protein 19 [Xylotrechus quadripes]
MKTVVLCLCVLALGATKPLSDEAKEMLKAIHEECAADSGVEKEDIMKVLEEDGDDQKIKDHVFCFQDKIGIITSEGTIDRALLKGKLSDFLEDEDKAEEIVNKCADEAEGKESPVERAFTLGKCIHREKPTE